MVKLVWEIPPLQAISEPEAQIQKHKYSLEETDYKQRDHHRLIVALSLLDEGLVAHIEHHVACRETSARHVRRIKFNK